MQASTNIRSLAREGKLPNEEDAALVLKLPVTFSSIVDMLVKNKEIMLEEHHQNKGVKFHLEAGEALQTKYRSEGSPSSTEIVVFDDEHSTSELVYGIARNR
jgi:hypothetical protein